MGFASAEEMVKQEQKEQEMLTQGNTLHDDKDRTTGRPPRVYREMSSMYLANERSPESGDKDLKSQSGLSGVTAKR